MSNGTYQFIKHYYEQICLEFGVPDIDLFASFENKQCQQFFCSPVMAVYYKDLPGCMGVDAFNQTWNKFKLPWCNPPYHLLPEIITKFETEK